MKKTIITVLAAIVVISYIYVTYSPVPKNEMKSPSVTNKPASVAADLSKEPIYTNETFGYSIKLPTTLEVVSNGSNSVLLETKEKVMGQGPTNFMYISVVTPENSKNDGEIYNYRSSQHAKLLELNIGESVSVSGDVPDLSEWFTYTRVDDTVIDGKTAKVFENYKPWEFPTGTTETRYVIEENGYTYLLGYYTGGTEGKDKIDPRAAYPVVQSFQSNYK